MSVVPYLEVVKAKGALLRSGYANCLFYDGTLASLPCLVAKVAELMCSELVR